MDSQHEDLLVGAEHIHGSPRVATSLGAAQCLYAPLLLLTSVYPAPLLPAVAQVRLPVPVTPHPCDRAYWVLIMSCISMELLVHSGVPS